MVSPILSVLATVAGIIAAFVLVFASLPWMLWAIGRASIGDDDGYDRAMESCPLNRYWDWLETR